jgi:hypothetical protein
VDDSDAERVRAFSWYAYSNRAGNTYAVRGAAAGVKPHIIPLHRWLLGAVPGDEVDHRDGDGLNNHRRNLRFSTRSQNNYNRLRLPKGKSSKFRGVCWDQQLGFWRAGAKTDGHYHFLGLFSNELDAARAYDRYIKQTAGEWARPNFA